MNRSSLCFVLCFSIAVLPCHAQITDGLDDMFASAGNAPTIYESQRRLGVDLGTVRLRAPVNTVNVFGYAPPNIDAGCGGVDFFGGSFSAINGEQFRQLLRQIGANALGYAFSLALGAMCQECDEKLSWLKDTMDALAAVELDSCKWAEGLVNSAVSGMSFKAGEDHKKRQTLSGVAQDTFQSVIDQFQDREAIDGGNPQGSNPANPETGNATWNMLKASEIGNDFTFVPSGINTNEWLLNIAGTRILATQNGSEEHIEKAFRSRLSYVDIRDGKNEATSGTTVTQLYQCPNQDHCNDMLPDADLAFGGVSEWVTERLIQAADHIRTNGGAPHPAEMINFLGTLPVPSTKHLMVLQGKPDALSAYAQKVGPILTDLYASTLTLAAVEAIRHGYTHDDSPAMPPSVETDLRTLEQEAWAAKVEFHSESLEKFNQIEALVKALDAGTSEGPHLRNGAG